MIELSIEAKKMAFSLWVAQITILNVIIATLLIKETLVEMKFINYVKSLLLTWFKLKFVFYFCILYNTNIVK